MVTILQAIHSGHLPKPPTFPHCGLGLSTENPGDRIGQVIWFTWFLETQNIFLAFYELEGHKMSALEEPERSSSPLQGH